MKYVILFSRIVLAVAFIVVGLNGFFNFLPAGPYDPGTPPQNFLDTLAQSHWLTFISVFQIAGGVLLLIGGSAPLGLVILGGILLNIIAFHFFLDGGNNLGPAVFLSVLELYLIYAYRNNFKSIFNFNAVPTPEKEEDEGYDLPKKNSKRDLSKLSKVY